MPAATQPPRATAELAHETGGIKSDQMVSEPLKLMGALELLQLRRRL